MNIRSSLLIVSVAATVCPATALAELRFCNRTGVKVEVAIAHAVKDAPGTTTNQDGGVTAEGWFAFEPGECAKVSDIDVGNHWTYYHAHGGGKLWDGSSMLCVPSSRFTQGVRFMHQGEACQGGRSLKGFRRMEAHTRGFTMNLNP